MIRETKYNNDNDENIRDSGILIETKEEMKKVERSKSTHSYRKRSGCIVIDHEKLLKDL